ncbi:S-methyl-5-thioribose-1-phosphate isomerase [Candidatus Uabimicrobium amorphum]|uniref:Methylthioribose-1-phosphate isomerase n=1 Tax=Uabimicrobium amorphum TaxID=2596890 RepID=A0A5S9II53_UABAM|nr:S-methyl-5-thioribose-1-phosphate isomerase [Candidatus Uabimicrobium amorphum]BBM82223.1 methylthioribose-1-phosphate isomerase [Candidatus Uabimicrobium amorphum]
MENTTIWLDKQDNRKVCVIDQRYLPHKFCTFEITCVAEAATAIRDMVVRGAPLIGVTAAYGMYFATLEANADSCEQDLQTAADTLAKTRPTAVNLKWAIHEQLSAISEVEDLESKRQVALRNAQKIANDDTAACKKIGEHGVELIREISAKKSGPVNILTHCNAGWLACINWGTATSPIYHAFLENIPIHVWVDETRPRNQGANLTAWEMQQRGVPHTVIVDNTGGHLMQHGLVDIVITGADRVTRGGDAANKIGTYLKALAAKDNDIPFYIALPTSTIDWQIEDGVKEIPIEERNQDEVKYIQGLCDGEIKKVLLTPPESPAKNYGFDVTPARLITGFITEEGIHDKICQLQKQENN